MALPTEALLYTVTQDGAVRCQLCAHACQIPVGARGRCGVRENQGGRLVSLVYGRLVARDVDPIEKKPLVHFLPGSRAYSIATVGCNFACQNCQNHAISQVSGERGGRVIGEVAAAVDVVAAAVEAGCRSIAYTYTEPTIALEYYLEVMQAAREAGLANVWVSNGYFSREAADLLLPLLDAANIDLKAITDDAYGRIAGARVRPVLDTIERLATAGVWVEVTTLVIPGHNDAVDDLRRTAEAVAAISPEIPWHVSRFFPAYRMADVPPTPVATLELARDLGRAAGLDYVYVGNVSGEGEDTRCARCGTLVVARVGYTVRANRLVGGRCPACGDAVPGVWDRGTG